jgi:hypothetical protein
VTSAYADATVEVIADFDRFDNTFAHRLRAAVTTGAANVQKSMGGMNTSINSVIRGMGRLAVSFVAIVGKAALAATAVAAFSAVTASAGLHLVAFVGALGPMTGLVAALPAAIAGAAAAMGVFKLATVGVKDAITSLAAGDLDKFNAALKNLSPNARAFAQELRALKPHLDSLRFGVQDRVFAGMAAQVRTLAASLLPVLRRGLGGLAAEINGAARQVAAFLAGGAARSQLAAILDSAGRSAHNLGAAITPIVRALLGVAQVGGPAIERITAAIGRAAERFAAWVQHATETGRLKDILDQAVAAAKTFGGVIGDVGHILATVFTSAANDGGDLLSNLKDITGAVAAFLGSTQGTEGLSGVFASIKAAGDPLLKTLGSVAGIVADSIAPVFAELAQAVGPGLDVLVKGIGEGLALLVPIAAPVGAAFSALAAALGPVAVQAGRLVAAVLGPLAAALTAILPAVSPLVYLLGNALVSAVDTLLPPFLGVVTIVVDALPHLLELGRVLLAAVVPAFGALEPALAVLLPALGAIASTLAGSLAPILPPLAAAIVAAFGPIPRYADSFVQLANALLPVVPAVAQLLPALIGLVPMFADLVSLLAQGLVPVLGAVIGPITDLSNWLTRYPRLVQGIVIAVGAWIAVTRIWAGLQAVKAWWMAREAALAVAANANNVAGAASTAALIGMTYARIAAERLWAAAQAASAGLGRVLLGIATGQLIKDAAITTWTYAKTAATWLWAAAQSGAAIAAGVWTAAQWALNIAMDANPIGLVVLAIVALVGIIVLAYRHSSTFRGIVQGLGKTFVAVGSAIMTAVTFVFGWLKDHWQLILAILTGPIGLAVLFVTKYWDDIKAVFLAGVAAVGGFFARMGGYVAEFLQWYVSLPGRVWDALLGLGAAIGGAVAAAWDWAFAAVRSGIAAFIDLHRQVAVRVLGALGALGAAIGNAVSAAWNWAYTAVRNGIETAIAFYAALPGRVWNGLLSLRDALAGAFGNAMAAAHAAISNGIATALGFFAGIRDQLAARLAGAVDWLRDAGTHIVEGLYNGIRDRFSVIFDAVKTLGESVPKWIKDALGISSPSTVMYEIGSWAGQGFANGITSEQARVKAAALRLKIAAEDGVKGANLGVGGSANVAERALGDARLSAMRGGPGSANAIERTYIRTQRDKELAQLAELDRIAAGRGTRIGGGGTAATFTPLPGLGGSAGMGMVSATATKSARAAAKALTDKAAQELQKRKDALNAAGKLLGDGFIQGLTSTNAKIKSTADTMAKLLTTALGAGGARPVIAAMDADSRRLRAMADSRIKVTADLAAAQKRLDDLMKASDKLRDSIAEKVRGSFQLIPSTGTRSVEALIRDMGRSVKAAQDFARNIDALKARGLATSLLQQLAESGPAAGGAMAARLARASAGQIAQLSAMSGRLESVATATGTSVAGAMYGAGIAASRGLVAGLTSQRRQIESAMLAIARSMAAAIRRALGIRSPSSVMMLVGQQAGAGLEQGLLSQVAPIRRAMATVGRQVSAPELTGRIPSGVPAQRAGSDRPGLQVNNTINLPTGDPEAAASAVVNRIAAAI